ncbi:hypothetical protein [Verminephrobacter eiseniae]|uniref:Uncharacterized protein n=1 Tax=Verminephrobacter eiseniae (strain EF01-2) TaxID=391735 RepID=A1WPN0_VEREI|nr:hypothetical protein [Verminephrobacter eiseniae]ABM59587.1 hypothetical protein Veis_3880 [Verminephrobacter eiseniae EF01-2]
MQADFTQSAFFLIFGLSGAHTETARQKQPHRRSGCIRSPRTTGSQSAGPDIAVQPVSVDHRDWSIVLWQHADLKWLAFGQWQLADRA